MKAPYLLTRRVHDLLDRAGATRVLVIGDVMLDQFIWGRVGRISPEAPVPVVEFQRESFMPGGAANVARNLTSLQARTELFGVFGKDPAGEQLTSLLRQYQIRSAGLLTHSSRPTSVTTRIVAHQ